MSRIVAEKRREMIKNILDCANIYKSRGEKPSRSVIARFLGITERQLARVMSSAGITFRFGRIDSPTKRQRIISLLGGKCCRCGFTDSRALQVDHIHGGGGREQKVLGRYQMCEKIMTELEAGNFSNYQLLCANCNWIKKHENKEHGRQKRAFGF